MCELQLVLSIIQGDSDEVSESFSNFFNRIFNQNVSKMTASDSTHRARHVELLLSKIGQMSPLQRSK